ncbi:biotin-dependent carboxyltransferase family protein [Pseudomonas sp.]|uniref:5-oxoprolinase subunit C family protein n=1 Tax=Pseudomonas sp. TaxID=306 RepID=UPI0019E14A87|nr:biotin-dependent carboxyltransferase family protein [Pseudomonas sp.]MBF0675827.1 biotin-dependent carboxyltransferase family protein [Pseudomonas sp.]
MMGLRVLKPGPLSLVQDAGRFGWQHLGVSPSGPLDGHAAAWANRLLGNPWGTPLVEIALGGVELQSAGNTWLALCGAELDIHIDDQPQANWARFPLRAGQRLRLGFARSGQRSYLAVTGGFCIVPKLGSVATQVREELGGVHGDGRALQLGDLLPCRPARLPGRVSVPWPYIPDYRREPELRLIAADGVDADALQHLLDQRWLISPHSDRMGVRLNGEALQAPRLQWSQGVVSGTIQVPPDGQPIILMTDRQTMGGYPLLGWLHPLDQWRLAQCPPHSGVRFAPVEVAQAQAELRAFYRFFR